MGNNKTRCKALARNSKLYAAGPEARKIILRKRIGGATYQEIVDFLNENFRDKLKKNDVYTMANVYQYFRIHGTQQIEMVKQKNYEIVANALSDSDSIEKLIKYLSSTIDYYQEKGERLRLKDAINSLIKMYELRIKMSEGNKKEGQTTEVSAFLNRVQKEFMAPSVVKRVEQEMDKEGNIIKQTATEIIREKKEEGITNVQDCKEVVYEQRDGNYSSEEETIDAEVVADGKSEEAVSASS